MPKLNSLATIALLFGTTLTVRAQEAADVDLAKRPAKEMSAEPTPIPSAPPESVPELSRLDEAFKQTSMGNAADTQKLRIEWRQLQNRVVNDEDLITMKRAANRARTDLEKREKLRVYYKLYYARLRRFPMSAGMRQYIETMETAHLGLTAQSRVRPSPSPEAR